LFFKDEPQLITENIIQEFKSWHTNVKLVFLNYINKNINRVTNSIYVNIRDKLNLHSGNNVEISYVWYEICMELKKDDVLENVKKFLLCNGRMKYIKPLYFKFYSHNRDEAIKFFKENK